MAKKDITVDCPCCDAQLVIDVLTQKVLRHRAKGWTAEVGWGDAAERVNEREARGTDAFDAALSNEQTRSKDLDDLFNEVKRKADDGEDS